MKSATIVLTMFLTFVLAAPAQDNGVIFCGSQASPKFTVPVREEPGRGLLVENATCGQQLVVLGIEQGYAKVKTWYSTGYVSLEFVQLLAPAPTLAIPYDRAVIECEGATMVPVYSNIHAASVIANLTCGQPVSFLEMERGYVRIQIAERIGYVAANFIKLERRKAEAPTIPAVPTVVPSPSNPPAVLATLPQAESHPQAPTTPAAQPVVPSPSVSPGISATRQQAENQSRAYPRAEVFGGYSYVHRDNSAGWMDGWNTAVTGNFHSVFGAKAELSGLYAKNTLYNNVRYSGYSFMAGPQLTARSRSVDAFCHALFGVSHLGGSIPVGGMRVGASFNAFSMALGGGVDWHRGKWDIRILQADYFPWRAFGITMHNIRLAAGYIFRIN